MAIQDYRLETRVELIEALGEVRRWEKEQKRVKLRDRITRLPFKLLDKITPEVIRDKTGRVLDELGRYIQYGGNYLVAGRKVGALMEKLSRERGGSGTGPYPLRVMDEAAERIGRSGSNTATVQGATTGFGGLFTLAADIPAVLGLSLKAIQEIGLCYGYDPTEEAERVFTVRVLQFAFADVVGKKAVLDVLARETGPGGEWLGAASRSSVSDIQGWREVIAAYRDSFATKKVMQAVPVVGVVLGAYNNRETLKSVGEAAAVLYRKRRILARLKENGAPLQLAGGGK
ncbi:EcsC family protein [Paenibacillus spiritus]|uniref:EcsC family protein n=1 Tax=Paenibacillus spiritus TaxID=2496557 RepID=A0A5J5GDH2_9BACL|nr:EcsC family protein [Paenibacillus spiritus]KAA9005832.1 EcsC family protein [Paenibacillus spiritus]